jgi:hypothetical protein
MQAAPPYENRVYTKESIKQKHAKHAPSWRGLEGAGRVSRLRPGARPARFTVLTRRCPCRAREGGGRSDLENASRNRAMARRPAVVPRTPSWVRRLGSILNLSKAARRLVLEAGQYSSA